MDREVMRQLVDQSGVSWPGRSHGAGLAGQLVRGEEGALFSRGYSGNLRSDVESVLLRASVPALDEALPGTAGPPRGEGGAHRRARAAHPAGMARAVPADRYRLSPELCALLGRRYLDAAVLDSDWLRQDRTGSSSCPGQ